MIKKSKKSKKTTASAVAMPEIVVEPAAAPSAAVIIDGEVVAAEPLGAQEEVAEAPVVETPVVETPVADDPAPEASNEPIAPAAPSKRGRKKTNATEAVAVPRRRGRPAFDRGAMTEAIIQTLRTSLRSPIFTKSDISSLGLPASYQIYLTQKAKTSIRGVYVVPREWRSQIPGYEQQLGAALKELVA